MLNSVINGTAIAIPEELIKKYDVAGPRYTSYPTAPVWTTDFQPKHLSTQAHRHISLYIHIPFCERRCLFCGCSTIATPKREIADRYVNALGREMSLVAENIGGKKRPVVQLHLGGGTPTYLSCSQLEKLREFQISNFNFAANAEMAVEADPRTITTDQLKLLGELGFNRISLGVQDFSEKVQKAIGRISPFSLVKKTADDARKYGFKSVNVDLIYGLPFQDKESFEKTVRDVISLSPDRIACFNFAHVPQAMPHQKKLPMEAAPKGTRKFEILCRTIEQLCLAGYDFIGMDHFAKKDDELTVAAREGTLRRDFQGYSARSGADLFGFGLTAISDAAGCYAQNAKKLADYYRAIESGGPATVRGWRLSDEDLKRRKIIRDLFCCGVAKLADSAEYHIGTSKNVIPTKVGIQNILKTLDSGFRRNDKDVVSRGAQISNLKSLQQDGLVEMKAGSIFVTMLGRLFVRNIAMAFDEYLNDKSCFSRTI